MDSGVCKYHFIVGLNFIGSLSSPCRVKFYTCVPMCCIHLWFRFYHYIICTCYSVVYYPFSFQHRCYNNYTGLQRNWGKHKNTRFYLIWGCWIQIWNPFLLITSSFLDMHSVHFVKAYITGFNAFSRKKIKYPNLRSAMRPVPHSDDLLVPTSPVNKDLLSSSDEKNAFNGGFCRVDIFGRY